MRMKKPKHHHLLKDPSSSENTIESIRNWVRKIEQSTQSISSRLAAVEKRFSKQTMDSSEHLVSDTCFEKTFKNKSNPLKTYKKQKQFEEISHALDQEFSRINQELFLQNQEIITLKEHLAVFNQLFNEGTQKIQQMQQDEVHRDEEISNCLHRLENRIPRVLKLGTVEIPIEITGVIGGILTFIIASLIALEQNELVFSPWFLVLIGFVLLGSAMIKTLHHGSTILKPWKTKEVTTYESAEK